MADKEKKGKSWWDTLSLGNGGAGQAQDAIKGRDEQLKRQEEEAMGIKRKKPKGSNKA